MFLHKSLPKKADIFIQSTQGNIFHLYSKPLFVLKLFTAVVLGITVLLTGAFILIPQPITDSSLAEHTQAMMAATNTDMNHDRDDRSRIRIAVATIPNPFPVFITNKVLRFKPIPPVVVPPIQNPMPFQTNASISNPINILASTSNISTVNQTGSQDIGGISSQIIAEQQQIGSQMQACVSNAINLANQLITLQNQQKTLQEHIDDLTTRANNIDTSTKEGQDEQNSINQRIQQLQQQMDNLNNAINNAQNNMNNANSQCQQNVSNLEQNRGQLESNLDDAFNNAMNIQLPQ